MTYLYYDKNGNPLEKRSSFFSEFGTYIHSILQLYLTGQLSISELSTYYVLHFAEQVRSPPPNSKVRNNYFTQGFEYFERFNYPKREILGVEQKMNFEFAGRQWIGYIDVCSRDRDNRLIITDHKSRTLKPRSNRKKPTKTDKELDDYLRQLYVYAVAVKESSGVYPDTLEFNCFRSNIFIRESFKPERLHEVEDWANTEIEYIITNSDWSAKPDFWRCSYLCDVCEHCEYRNLM